MKLLLAITLLFLVTMGVTVAPKKNSMEGTWKFVSGKYTYPDRVEQYDASQRKTI